MPTTRMTKSRMTNWRIKMHHYLTTLDPRFSHSWFSHSQFSRNSQFSHSFASYQLHGYCKIWLELVLLLNISTYLLLTKKMTQLRFDCIYVFIKFLWLTVTFALKLSKSLDDVVRYCEAPCANDHIFRSIGVCPQWAGMDLLYY